MASMVGKTKLKKGMKAGDKFWEDEREYLITGFDADGNYISRATDADIMDEDEDEIPGEPQPEDVPLGENQPPAQE